MICKFCSQWNPDAEQRCCFCDNELAAADDRTLSGQPAYVRNAGAVMPTAIPSRFDQQRKRPFSALPDSFTLTLTPRTIGIIAGAVGALLVLLLIVRC